MKLAVATTVMSGLVLSLAATGAFARDDAQTARSRSRAPAPVPVGETTPANLTDPEGYERDLQAAKDQRDLDLKDAAKETDRARFERRKQEIFARYASILIALRDKYEAQQGEDGVTRPAQRPGTKYVSARNGSTAGRTGTTERIGARQQTARRDDAKSPRPTRSAEDAAAELADAQRKLDDENARHDATMAELTRQLETAQDAGDKREIRKAQRAIDKENNAYQAKRSALEKRVRELGGATGDKEAPPLARVRPAAR